MNELFVLQQVDGGIWRVASPVMGTFALLFLGMVIVECISRPSARGISEIKLWYWYCIFMFFYVSFFMYRYLNRALSDFQGISAEQTASIAQGYLPIFGAGLVPAMILYVLLENYPLEADESEEAGRKRRRLKDIEWERRAS